MDLLEWKKTLIGTCKLTGKRGKYVKSHIIPAALSLPPRKDRGLVQLGLTGRSSRRWTSWYDTAIVIEEGEQILSSIDNKAIQVLRKSNLVWSGWGPILSLYDRKHPINVRVIKNIDSKVLRLFFLSILWRAAVTSRYEFREVVLRHSAVNQLRNMICCESIYPLDVFPIALVQISSLGPWHNRSPIAESYFAKEILGYKYPDTGFFRFYMDGLIAHIHHKATKEFSELSDVGILIGASDTIVVNCIPYEHSRQALDMEYLGKRRG